MEFRRLRADEIEVRIGAVSAKGATLLFYKNARCDMNILDEVVGAEHWQRDHKDVKGNLYCGVGIEVAPDKWVWKWDCGSESNTEKEKGEASDSFKRACFNWGIGRELYTAPFTWIKCETQPKATVHGYELTAESRRDLGGVYVSDISYSEDDKISAVTVCSKNGVPIFEWKAEKSDKVLLDELRKPIKESEKKTLMALCDKKGVNTIDLLSSVGWEGGDITKQQHAEALKKLGRKA